jgi:hypothetical protein
VRANIRAHTDYPMLAVVATSQMHALSPAAAAPAAAVRAGPRRCWPRYWPRATSTASFDLVHPEATAAAICGMGIRAASRDPAPEAGLKPLPHSSAVRSRDLA